MEGIILISHGKLAEGMYDTIGQFFSAAEQITCLTLGMEENSDDFERKLKNAITKVDTGDGVILAVDILGGTPCNKAIAVAGEKVRVLAGINLGCILEILSVRNEGRVDLNKIAELGRAAMLVIDGMPFEQEDEDF